MFLAIVIPETRKEKPIFSVVTASFIFSFVFSKISAFASVPESIRVIILTVILAGAAAFIFPVNEKEEDK